MLLQKHSQQQPTMRENYWRPRGGTVDNILRIENWRLPQTLIGPLLQTIKLEDIKPSNKFNDDSATITSCEYSASYNWMDTEKASITVPGRPPFWAPPAQEIQLPRDSGTYFRDENAARSPQHPIEPAVRAVLVQNPDVKTDEFDVFACNNVIENLLKIVLGYGEKKIRFDVEVVGSTVFFVRKEQSPTEIIDGNTGYGHTFPAAYTAWDVDVSGSALSNRIMRYQLGGLQFLVRCSCDGYYKDNAPEHEAVMSGSVEAIEKTKETSANEIELPNGNKISKAEDVAPALTVTPGGCIPQEALIEIRTKSRGSELDMDDAYIRLWATQVPNLVHAYHHDGFFEDIRLENHRANVLDWEKQHQKSLSRFVVLVRQIVSFAKRNSDKKLEIIRKPHGDIEIHEQAEGGREALTAATKQEWVSNALSRGQSH